MGCVSRPTFWSFDEFDLDDGLDHGPAAPDVQPNYGAGDLQGLHRFTVRHLRHVCVVNPQNAVVYSGGQSSNHVSDGETTSGNTTRSPKTLLGGLKRAENRNREI